MPLWLEGGHEQVFRQEARHATVDAATEAVVGALPRLRINIDPFTNTVGEPKKRLETASSGLATSTSSTWTSIPSLATTCLTNATVGA
jgi:hypothetical protein